MQRIPFGNKIEAHRPYRRFLWARIDAAPENNLDWLVGSRGAKRSRKPMGGFMWPKPW